MAFRNSNGPIVVSASRTSARQMVARLMALPMKSDCSCANLSSVATSAWVKATPTLLSGAGGAGVVSWLLALQVKKLKKPEQGTVAVSTAVDIC